MRFLWNAQLKTIRPTISAALLIPKALFHWWPLHWSWPLGRPQSWLNWSPVDVAWFHAAAPGEVSEGRGTRLQLMKLLGDSVWWVVTVWLCQKDTKQCRDITKLACYRSQQQCNRSCGRHSLTEFVWLLANSDCVTLTLSLFMKSMKLVIPSRVISQVKWHNFLILTGGAFYLIQWGWNFP